MDGFQIELQLLRVQHLSFPSLGAFSKYIYQHVRSRCMQSKKSTCTPTPSFFRLLANKLFQIRRYRSIVMLRVDPKSIGALD